MNAQAMENLRVGDAFRIESARLRREAGALPRQESWLRLAELLEDPPESIQRTRVDRFLASGNVLGPAKVADILRRTGVQAHRYIGPESGSARQSRLVLSERQRRVLATELRRRAGA